MGVVPTVAYNHPQSIPALTESLGYVIREIHHAVAAEIILDGDIYLRKTRPFAVIGEIRYQHLITDFISVHIEFKISQTCHKSHCRSDFLVQIDLLTEVWCRSGILFFPFLLPWGTYSKRDFSLWF